MKRETLLSIVRFLLNTLTKVEFFGLEHIPHAGKLIVATNHISRLDTPFLFITPNRTDITALVADKYKKDLLFSFMLNTAGCIWIDRSKADFGAFNAAQKALDTGIALGIAPEGTRSKNAQLNEGKAGIALIAIKTNTPILPVGVTGTEKAIRQVLTLQRPHLVARFGPVYKPPPLDDQDRKGSLQRITDEIMCRIAALLPESYRGFYANHPRLKELLAETSSFFKTTPLAARPAQRSAARG